MRIGVGLGAPGIAARSRGGAASVIAPVSTTLTFALAGSSSPAQFFSTYGYSSPYTDVSQSSTDGTTFANSTQGAMVRTAATSIFNVTGKKSRWIGKAVAGTTLYSGTDPAQVWSIDGSTLTSGLIAAINAYTAANPTQPFTGVLTQVGLNDFNDSTASMATILAAYRKWISTIRSGTNLPNLPIFVLGTQDKPDAPKSVAAQRQAEETLAGDANVYLCLQTQDAALNDAIHQNETGQIQTGNRFGAFITAFVNGATLSRGMKVTGATSVTDTTTRVAVQHVLGTDFTPTTGITGFLLTNAAGSAIAISNTARETATSILLTHASRYDSGVSTVLYLPNGGQTTDDTATTVHDNSPLALPMETSFPFTLAAITTPVGAPVFSTQPSITTDGTPQVGETMTGNTGTASGSPTYARRWLLNGTAVSTAATYAPTATGSLVLEVTATNGSGSTVANSPTVTVAAATVSPTLNALSVSPSTSTVGTAYTGTVSGTTSGSTLSLTGAGAAGLSVTGTTISGTPTIAGAVNIVETLSGATNSPRTSSGVITVTAAAGGGYTATGKSAQISYGSNDISSVPAGWNTRRPDDKATPKALLTPAGAASGWTDTLLATPSGGANILGNSNAARPNWQANGERYDNGLFKSFWYLGSADRAAHQYSGFDNTKFYDIEVSADRDATGARTSSYIVGGVTKTLQTVGNYPGAAPDASPSTRFVLFEKVQPSGGIITLNWGNSTGASFGYVGPVIIREFSAA